MYFLFRLRMEKCLFISVTEERKTTERRRNLTVQASEQASSWWSTYLSHSASAVDTLATVVSNAISNLNLKKEEVSP